MTCDSGVAVYVSLTGTITRTATVPFDSPKQNYALGEP